MIKSAKRAIKATIGNAELTNEELVTAFVCAEGLMNSRPLVYQGDDHCDDPVLTPNHFLIGQASGQLAPTSVDSDYNPRRRWRRVQELTGQFWQRWLKEYLPTLTGRAKWNKQERDFRVDDVVIVVDPQNPRGKWPLGRITDVMPGTDGHIRVVNVKIGDTVYRRPIHRLCHLPVD